MLPRPASPLLLERTVPSGSLAQLLHVQQPRVCGWSCAPGGLGPGQGREGAPSGHAGLAQGWALASAPLHWPESLQS